MAMTIVEFAERAGVSTATVWRAVNGAKGISPETRDRVLRRMQEPDMPRQRATVKPNLIIRGSSSGRRSGVLGLGPASMEP